METHESDENICINAERINNDDLKICKICQSEESEDDIWCHPCKCIGTIKYIHKECLLLFMKSTGKDYCTVCKFVYKFKDIYKDGTPKFLPISLIVKELGKSIYRGIKLFFKYWIALFIVLSTVAINSICMVEALELNIKEYMNYKISLIIILGIIVSVMSFLQYHFYKSVKTFLIQRSINSRLRIDSLNVISAMASDAMSSIDSESQRSMMSSMTQQRNQEFLNALENSGNTFVNQNESSSETTEQIPTGETIYLKIDHKLPLKGTCVGIIIFIISKILKYMPFRYIDCQMSVFLKDIFMYNLTLGIFLFYMCLLTSQFILKRLRIYLKILNVVFIGFMIILYIDGVCLHFIFSKYLNNGVIIDFKDYELRTLYSFIFHFTIGLVFNSLIKNITNNLKDKFRSGVLWSFADPKDNYVEILYKTTRVSSFRTLIKAFKISVIHIIILLVFVTLTKPEINFNVKISSPLQIILAIKLIFMYKESLDMFIKHIVNLTNIIIKLLSRHMKMNNFLYGENIKEPLNHECIKWCPNKHKIYDHQKVEKMRQKKVRQGDVSAYFNKPVSKSFSLFYIPQYFQIYVLLLISVFSLIMACAFKLLLVVVKEVCNYMIYMCPYAEEYSGIVFMLVFGSIIYFPFSMLEYRSVFDFLKISLYNIYINLVWPAWGTLIILLMYGSDKCILKPSMLFINLFMSSIFIDILIRKLLFQIGVHNYSIRNIIRRLYSFTSTITMCLCGIRYIREWIVSSLYKTFDIPMVYIVSSVLLLFYIQRIVTKSLINFYDRIKRENYLLDREIINYEK